MKLLRYLPLLLLSGCVSTGSDEGVACATPSSFTELTELEQQGCPLDRLLAAFDDGSEARRELIASHLAARGDYELAAQWYQRAATFEAYQALLVLYAPGGRLADDAAYLATEVKRAQLQQAFGQAVDWPQVGQAQPLYVSRERSVLLAEPETDAAVLEALTEDEQVFLLDVVLLEDRDEYWVRAYYPSTLALGWIPADELAQQTRYVRDEMASLDTFAGRTYAQQLLVGVVIATMDLRSLQPLAERDFFAGAQTQQANSVALLQAIGKATDTCMAEVAELENDLQRYLMDEAPAPTIDAAPEVDIMRNALAALTGGEDESLRNEIQNDAYTFFRVRVQGQVEQRLCFSLPNAAGEPDYAETVCEAMQALQQCVNRADAIFDYL